MSKRWLICGEYSGTLRDGLRARGVDAVSCDKHPTERPGPHYQGDWRDIIGQGWYGMIGHPTCTFLCASGTKHLYAGKKLGTGYDEARWDSFCAAVDDYLFLLDYDDIECRVIENPVMHGYAIEYIGSNADQFVQPWMHGDPAFKLTGLHLRNVPPLPESANSLRAVVPAKGTDEYKRWSSVHRAAPKKDRWKERSRTFPGFGDALAAHCARL